MLKSLFSAAAIALTFALFYPYVRSIILGETKPHVLSWVIWSIGTFTVFFAQLADGAGIGAWPIGLSALITSYVALLSWMKRSDLSITPFDWGCLVTAVLALTIWLITSSPFWAVLILTGIDVVGFGPTVRKAYSRPHEERIWFFLLGALRNAFVIAALEHYSATTVVFPAAVGVACFALAVFIALRRQTLATAQTQRAA
jgi:hypothetical protein